MTKHYLGVNWLRPTAPDMWLEGRAASHRRLLQKAAEQALAGRTVDKKTFMQILRLGLFNKAPTVVSNMVGSLRYGVVFQLPYSYTLKVANSYRPYMTNYQLGDPRGKRPHDICIVYTGFLLFSAGGKLLMVDERQPINQTFFIKKDEWIRHNP